jgi:nucleoside-diphosphate-sugar epimerase
MRILVTGATGFLGKALVRRLLSLGLDVTAQGRNSSILAQLETEGAHSIQANLADTTAIQTACKNKEVVFHSGALSSPWGRFEDFFQSNVTGTRCVVQGCKDGNVSRLVFVSTPSIYFHYNSRLNVVEDASLPSKPVNAYAQTKLLAEKEIDQSFTDGLSVITLRPRAIFGPGDTSILPRLIDRLQHDRLPIIGDGQNIIDLTYIDNVVDALILCMHSPQNTLGQKFNITNGEPVQLWEMVKKLCAELGLIYPQRQLSYRLADHVAAVLEGIYHLLPGRPEPPLTRYTVSVLAQSSTLDITAARKYLGYEPAVTIEEGFSRFIYWWKETH